MEFWDEDARPRFLFQSKPQSNPQTNQAKAINKVFIVFTISFSALFLLLSIFFLQTEPYRSLLVWLSLSLLVAPFAPPHLTGGDIRVGRGPVLDPLVESEPEVLPEKQARKKRSKPVRSEEIVRVPAPAAVSGNGSAGNERKVETLAGRSGNAAAAAAARKGGEGEWTEEDVEVLKKQMGKNPVGKPRRWEVIAEVFDGRHGVEGVVKKAKELGEKKMDDSDSYARFLKNRKPLDTRIGGEMGEVNESGESEKDVNGGGGGVGWSSGEDIALLNALKTFPKEVTMRWEKIAAAVPGKSKAACMKRVAELKRDFRSSKAGGES
ncbi:hypothetical protein Tsubulata_037678 [Turnera subulata]|uniref:Myb-like domain-containing protein n=1 Tax=Turnera subulata TaxID=218843 RepID=A0A9Q0G8H7_9ROSI|nr:hypothetical protein Tsubulata_037678 [Turnera subulata]